MVFNIYVIHFMDIPPRYKWDIMWGGEDNGTYYTKKYFYKQLNWFTHHNDRYTVVATMNLELKAIIQVYLNSNVNSKKYLLQQSSALLLLHRLQSPKDIRQGGGKMQDDRNLQTKGDLVC